MKKLISVVLAVLMAFSTMAVSFSVMAKDLVISPTATTANNKKPILEVNGSTTTTDITYTVDPTDPNKVTFTYTGDGTLLGWENNLTDDLGFVDGADYTAVFNDDGSYTITFISVEAIKAWEDGTVIVNAIVEYDEETTTGKKNDSHKSPGTGASTSVVAATIAVACAGFAVLAATKKRDAE